MKTSNGKMPSLMNIIQLRKPYVAEDFQVTSSELKVRKDSYRLDKIRDIKLKRLSFADNLLKVITFAVILSAATWAFVPQFGFFALLISLLLALVSIRKYELKAEFKGTDETGDYWVSIARCWNENEFHILENLHSELKSRI